MKRKAIQWLCAVLAVAMLFGIVGCDTQIEGDSTTTSSSNTTTTDGVPTSTESTTQIPATDGTTDTTSSAGTTSIDSTAVSTVTTTVKTTASTATSKTKPTASASSSTATTATTASTKRTFKTIATTTAATVPTFTAAQRRDHVGFGYYGISLDTIETESKKQYINTQLIHVNPYQFPSAVENAILPYLRKVKELGGDQMVWLNITDLIFSISSSVAVVNSGWQSRLDSMMQTIEQEGLLDYVWGFYYEEPFYLNIKKNDLRDSSKYLRETYPDLRVFAIFAVSAIDPKVHDNGSDQILDPDSAQYLTDVGYDMYRDMSSNYSTYKSLNETLKQRLGRDDVRIWYVPGLNLQGTVTQKQAIAHLNGLFRFLKEEKNPGGLFCYSYGDYVKVQAEWLDVEERLIEVGQEIIAHNREGCDDWL